MEYILKKLFITAYDLNTGGIEKALINLLHSLDYKKYEVTLLLEKKEGLFLDEVEKEVQIEEYKIHDDKFVLKRKIKNRKKLWDWKKENENKYDFALCFAPYSIPGCLLTRIASKKNAIVIHSNYRYVYHDDKKKVKTFFNQRQIQKFGKIVFVAKEAQNDFCEIYKELRNKTLVLNNILDYETVLEKSKEKLPIKKPREPLLLFVGRLEEESKRLTRLFSSLVLLKKENVPFKLWIAGDGKDLSFYQEKVQSLGLEKNVLFLGKKKNPYPYMVASDLIVLTSDYEGFPVTCMEAIILKKPFLSTINISDNYISLEDYGYIVSKDEKEIKEKISEIIKEKKEIKRQLNVKAYNEKLKKDFLQLIDGE